MMPVTVPSWLEDPLKVAFPEIVPLLVELLLKVALPARVPVLLEDSLNVQVGPGAVKIHAEVS